jgi:hypothetical protein
MDAGECGRGPNAVLAPDKVVAYGVNRKTNLWLVLTRIWGLNEIDKSVYDAVIVRSLSHVSCHALAKGRMAEVQWHRVVTGQHAALL